MYICVIQKIFLLLLLLLYYYYPDYIGETKRNASKGWDEHSSGQDNNSKCKKRLNKNYSHGLKWFVLSCDFPKNKGAFYV